LRFEKRDVASIKEGLQICSRAAGNFLPRIYLNVTSLHPHSEKQKRLKKGYLSAIENPHSQFSGNQFFSSTTVIAPPPHHRHTNAAIATVLTAAPAPVL
jgi:hypothetical protein